MTFQVPLVHFISLFAQAEKDLLDAIKNMLRKNGALSKIQAEMRAKVTEILHCRQLTNNSDGCNFCAPPPTQEVLLINDLIKEYLEWNGYMYTATVLTSEAALSNEKRTRADLCTEVGVKDDEKSSALPLLSNIVAAYTDRIKRKINKIKKDCS